MRIIVDFICQFVQQLIQHELQVHYLHSRGGSLTLQLRLCRKTPCADTYTHTLLAL